MLFLILYYAFPFCCCCTVHLLPSKTYPLKLCVCTDLRRVLCTKQKKKQKTMSMSLIHRSAFRDYFQIVFVYIYDMLPCVVMYFFAIVFHLTQSIFHSFSVCLDSYIWYTKYLFLAYFLCSYRPTSNIYFFI